jgi:hypothetical protein
MQVVLLLMLYFKLYKGLVKVFNYYDVKTIYKNHNLITL